MKKKLKTREGITLIALIITIIIMLILVAVIINMVINGGLFEKAGKAVGETQNAINKEQELTNGRIQVNGVWYDSIDGFFKGIPSKNQETTLQWKQFAASNEEVLALNSYGDIYTYSPPNPENDTELDAKFRELIANNGSVVNISINVTAFGYVYIMENGKAYYLQDNNFVCINDSYENLKNAKIVHVTLIGFIITEDGRAYAPDGNIWLNDEIPALKNKKILDMMECSLPNGETVLMVILDDQKAYYLNSPEGTLICFSDEHEELKNTKIVSTFLFGETIFVTSDGKAYSYSSSGVGCLNDSYEELKDKKIVKIDFSYSGKIYILDSGELLLENETLSILNEQYEALQGKKIMGYDSANKLVWLEGGESYYSINDNAIVNFSNSDMVAFLQGKNIVQIAAYYDNFTAVDINGKVWTWGNNSFGKLGDGTTTARSSPVCISDIKDNTLNGIKIKQISSGRWHTVAVDSNGKVWTWGYDDARLGKTVQSKAKAFRLALVSIITTPTCISDKEGSPLNNIKIKQISAGSEHTVALDENGKVWTWGNNGYGQLGYGAETDSGTPICISDMTENPLNGINIVQISTEDDHTVALDSNGKVWTWGRNWGGQLGDGTTTSSTPICISNIAENPLNGIKIKQISAGSCHTVALDENGKVWAWGQNTVGQLADGTTTSSSTPICISDINSELNGKQITVVEAGTCRTVLLDNNNNKYNIFGGAVM